MWLDLSALKKINTDGGTETVSEESEITTATAPIAGTSGSSSQTPKISLSKLKQGKNQTSKDEITPEKIEGIATLEEVSKPLSNTADTGWAPKLDMEAPVTVESIVTDTTKDEGDLGFLEEDTKEATLGIKELSQEGSAEKSETLQETLSLISEETPTGENSTEAQKKEFFPNLDVTSEFSLEDDIFWTKQEETAIMTEPQTDLVLDTKTPSTHEIATTEELTLRETPDLIVFDAPEEKPIDPSEPVTVYAVKRDPSAITPEIVPEPEVASVEVVETPVATIEETPATVTTEYVQEVKQELSSDRQSGWLAKFKKITIFAVLGGALTVIGLLGVGVFMKHQGITPKANVLESTNIPNDTAPITQNPEATPANPEPTTPVVTESGSSDSGTTDSGNIIPPVVAGSGDTTESGNSDSGAITPPSFPATESGTEILPPLVESSWSEVNQTGAISNSGSETVQTGTTDSGELSPLLPPVIQNPNYTIVENPKRNIPRKKNPPVPTNPEATPAPMQ